VAMTVVASALCALALTLVLTPVAMKVARRAGIVDKPGPLKPQSAPVPYLGGAAVMAALVPACAIARPVLLVPLFMAFALGVADDVVDLPPLTRLVCQAAIGTAIAFCVPTVFAHPVAVVLAIAATMVLTNGVNMLDGLDALVAGTVAATAGGFALIDSGSSRDLAVAVLCSAAAFLVFNRPPARIYLGDGGAYLLGAALTEMLAWTWAPGVRGSTRAGALLLVAIPVAELAFAVVRRARSRSALVSGDRGHTYDVMVARGRPVWFVSGSFVVAQVVIGAVALGVSSSRSVAAGVAAIVAIGLAMSSAAMAGGVLTPNGGSGS
jgi:UDP-GlcNAc:undecaprenyl-phosphate GlcNAc-1-phosphate transferase